MSYGSASEDWRRPKTLAAAAAERAELASPPPSAGTNATGGSGGGGNAAMVVTAMGGGMLLLMGLVALLVSAGSSGAPTDAVSTAAGVNAVGARVAASTEFVDPLSDAIPMPSSPSSPSPSGAVSGASALEPAATVRVPSKHEKRDHHDSSARKEHGASAAAKTKPFVFPKDFEFGTATSAYQVEGAAKEGGRGASIWDVFSHTPGRVANGDTGDVAIDQFHRFGEDIAAMRAMGVAVYRFSISPTRILPNGTLPVNAAGVAHYNRLIDALLSAGIQPMITLYHWDLPQALHDAYGGWLDRRSIGDFEVYADVCFREFGDRVSRWLTFNEPWTFAFLGYGTGTHAPGRCSRDCSAKAAGAVNPMWAPPASSQSQPQVAAAVNKAAEPPTCAGGGNTATEPYIVAHHVLLAHARVVKLYRDKYQTRSPRHGGGSGGGGQIGITLNCDWNTPLDPTSAADREASERAVEFQLGWFADPIWFGDYPASMRRLVGDRLPRFTDDERALLKGSHDGFFGLNHYSTAYTFAATHKTCDGWQDDRMVNTTFTAANGTAIGAAADVSWLRVVPWGFRALLNYVHTRYHKPAIFVTENGVAVPGESDMPLVAALNDTFRVQYYEQYLTALAQAIEHDGVNVRGYTAWSFSDNFEWSDGYSKRFGLHYIDYTTLKRYPKRSAEWFGSLVRREFQLRV